PSRHRPTHGSTLFPYTTLFRSRSDDGIAFKVDDMPALSPQVDMEEYGVEDPRATFVDGRWHITYVSVSRWGITTSLATTKDFRSDRKSTRLNSSHRTISYAVFC